ncbi:MAG: class I SAM-dependent methyltransferase [Pseudohongiellaceae bacterium]|jgi:predicted nicotinamide N-methyase
MSTAEKHIKEVRGLKIYKKKHQAIKKLLKDTSTPEIHGDKVWFSSYLIHDYLLENPPKKKANIMEIGCGWGILAIHCNKEFKANVTAVDADKNVFPYLDMHAKLNKAKVTNKVSRYENLKASLLAEQDMILGGDICFWNELIDPLLKLIKKALKNGVDTIIIADPGRSPFLKLAKQCKKLYDAELIEVELEDPIEEDGYLLIIRQ